MGTVELGCGVDTERGIRGGKYGLSNIHLSNIGTLCEIEMYY